MCLRWLRTHTYSAENEDPQYAASSLGLLCFNAEIRIRDMLQDLLSLASLFQTKTRNQLRARGLEARHERQESLYKYDRMLLFRR